MKYIVHMIYNNIMKYDENKFKRDVSKVRKWIYIHTAIRIHAYQNTHAF